MDDDARMEQVVESIQIACIACSQPSGHHCFARIQATGNYRIDTAGLDFESEGGIVIRTSPLGVRHRAKRPGKGFGRLAEAGGAGASNLGRHPRVRAFHDKQEVGGCVG